MRAEVKRQVWARDKYTCHYCNVKLMEHTATVDHVIPRSHPNKALLKGKKDNLSNLVTACKACNQFKGNRIPEASCIIMPAHKAKKYETIRKV